MGFLQRLSTVSGPLRLRAAAGASSDPFASLYSSYVPPTWVGGLAASGMSVTPDLALTLSAFYSGTSMIAHDLATLPVQAFRRRDDEGKDRVRPTYGAGLDASNGISSLAYMLRWQPNAYQTATEFFVSMVAQYLMRAKGYAEIISSPATGFVGQLLPRHPDRVRPEMLPSGRVRYRLTELGGKPRWLTQDEMFVVRDPLDGTINPTSRVEYSAQAVGTVLAAERAAAKFFKSGMTASTVATYTGDMEREEEEALHASITRYATGVENSFGLMLIPDDVKIANLSIEPEKAQMMAAREFGLYEVARLLHLPPHKLAIKGTQTYASQVQSAVDYVIGCLRPIAVAFEQALQRDLVLAKDAYFFEFLLEALLRGDPDARASYYERAIRARWMRPSEVRLRENMNPDPELDKLSAGDFRPGASAGSGATGTAAPASVGASRAHGSSREYVASFMAVHDNAVRCLRRERAAVAKLATKHAADVPGWQAGLRDFFADQASFIAQTMRLPVSVAREYAAQHGSELEARGVVVHSDDWERWEADELAALALDGQAA
jgi:HK97 family phage portal protein